MTYAEAVAITERLRERGNASFSSSEKDEISKLYKRVLGKEFRVTSCQRCYHDAVIEITLYLRRNKNMAEEIKERNYELRAGFIIHATQFYDGKIFTNANLTDEIAAEYLKKFPQKERFFAKVPQKADFKPSKAKKEVSGNNVPPTNKKPRKTKKAKK